MYISKKKQYIYKSVINLKLKLNTSVRINNWYGLGMHRPYMKKLSVYT